MQANTTSVRGRKKPPMPKMSGKVPKGKLRHLHVRPADNGGFSVDSEHEVEGKQPKPGKRPMFGPETASHSAVFGNAQDALGHIGSLMGAAGQPAPEAPPVPAAGTPEPPDEEEEE